MGNNVTGATLENTLPYTVGDKAGYRTDEKGNRFTSTDFKNIASKIGANFNLSTPRLSGQNFLDWVKGYNDVATTGTIKTYSNEEIDRVKGNSLSSIVANAWIKKQYGQQNNMA